MKYRLFVIANLGFIIGILMGLYSKVSIILFLSIFVGGVVAVLGSKYVVSCLKNVQNNRGIRFAGFKKKFYKLFRYCKVYITKMVLITFISFLILGYVVLSFREMKFENFVNDMLTLEIRDNIVGFGIVVSDKANKDYSDVYRIKVLEVNGVRYSNTYCFLRVKKEANKELKYGDLVRFAGEFQESQDRSNFKGFSYKEYLKTINVYGTFEGTYGRVQILKEEHLSWFFLAANKVKNSFERTD